MMRQSKQSMINELERSLKSEQDYIDRIKKELDAAHSRLKLIAAENETLLADKKWLQSMHSNLLQSLYARKI